MVRSMDILDKIVQHKQTQVARQKDRVPETKIREMAEKAKTAARFIKCLEKPGQKGINIIAEIKRASPSKGTIRADLIPRQFAADYEKGGAAAISVLTDEFFFKGSSHDLAEVKKAVKLPVLRKDFIISAYQIYESAIMQADGILLIARILEPQQLRDFIHLSHQLGMDPLVEIHTIDDYKKADRAGARLIGINNRDLKTFKTDIETTLSMASLFTDRQIAVAESGINNRDDILKLKAAGIHNFLIGESIVRADDQQKFIRFLLEI